MAEEVLAAFEQAMSSGAEAQLAARWGTTATSGGGLGQGDATVLTYSFVPDGTPMPSGQGEPTTPSSLFAAFNAAFGGAATWQALIQQAATRWGDTTGLNLVFEANDDGGPLGTLQGQLGIRGDIRIGGHPIDGSTGSNLLAYNYYPNNGDMVLDTDNVANFAAAANNFLYFRNLVMHEFGHGIGLRHNCPAIQTKLMEPYHTTAFDGPQHDDLLGAERHYGDRYEPNDTLVTATALGAASGTQLVVDDLSIDDDSDVDEFTVTAGAASVLTVVVEPVGQTYPQAPQPGTQPCAAGGTTYNSLTLNDLRLEILDATGSTLLAASNSGGPGTTETATTAVPPGGALFRVRVLGGTADEVQLYRLRISTAQGPTNAVQLQQGTATYSQLGFSPAQCYNGVFAPSVSPQGWGIAENSLLCATIANSQIAVWQTTMNIQAGTITFTMYQQSINCFELIGRFRWSVTTDNRSTYANGAATGGTVAANWTVLGAPTSVTLPAPMTYTMLLGDWILTSASIAGAAVCPNSNGNVPLCRGNYILTYSVPSAIACGPGITGIRLEVMKDPSLPCCGPGHHTTPTAGGGNFELTQLVVAYTPSVIPPNPILNLFGSTGPGGANLSLWATGVPCGGTVGATLVSFTPAIGGPGTGPVFGLQPDFITWALILVAQPALPPAVDPWMFDLTLPGAGTAYPYFPWHAPWGSSVVFSPGVITDLALIIFSPSQNSILASNVVRLTF